MGLSSWCSSQAFNWPADKLRKCVESHLGYSMRVHNSTHIPLASPQWHGPDQAEQRLQTVFFLYTWGKETGLICIWLTKNVHWNYHIKFLSTSKEFEKTAQWHLTFIKNLNYLWLPHSFFCNKDMEVSHIKMDKYYWQLFTFKIHLKLLLGWLRKMNYLQYMFEVYFSFGQTKLLPFLLVCLMTLKTNFL